MTTRSLYWSVRRELWEYRSVWMAPLAVAVIGIIGFLASAPGLPGRVRALSGPNMDEAHLAIHMPYGAVAILGFATAFIVGAFYCLDSFQGERRDRSILFWKSLPVSDAVTVLSKAAIPFAVLPAIVFALTVATQLVMVLVSAVVLISNDAGRSLLWANVQPFQSIVTVLYIVIFMTLWQAPIYAWLMLVSGWTRRAAMLWAVLPILVVAGVERIVFGTLHFLHFLRFRALGWSERGLAFGDETTGMTPLLESLRPGRVLATPSFWIGLLFAAACLAAAIRLRRSREPV